MYQLALITNPSDCPYIQAFINDLPKKPYCTNGKGFCYPRAKHQAIKYSYIQPNHPAVIQWLVFDLDYDQALFAYFDNNVIRPQLIIKNPENGHAHYCYRLSEKVGLWGNSSVRAIKYLDAVYNALKRKLEADLSYSGNLVKNPTQKEWQTYSTGAKHSYTLDELANHLDLETTTTDSFQANDDEYYFGRNHEIFERTRLQTYPIAQQYSYEGLYRVVLAIAEDENSKFDNPLPHNELTHIARSITRFCKSARFGRYSEQSNARFSKLQAYRATKANEKGVNSKGGVARSAKYADKRAMAMEMRLKGLSIRKIAECLGVSKTSVQAWLKQRDGFKKVYQVPANQIIAP